VAHKAVEPLAEPKPTVRDALRFRELAGATLAGGEAGLDRAIKWVRLMETPEIIPRTGDLLLTTGFPIKDDRAAQIRLISRIAEAGGAGVVGVFTAVDALRALVDALKAPPATAA